MNLPPPSIENISETISINNSIGGRFSGLASRYEKSTAGAHNEIARKLVRMSPPFTKDSVVLDNATGTGIVIEEIQQYISTSNPNSDIKIPVFAADIARPMIDYLNIRIEHCQAAGSWPNLHPVRTLTVAAEELDSSMIRDDSITHAYMNFGLFFCSDPIRAASHIYRSLALGGVAYISTWRDSMHMEPIRHTLNILYPDNPPIKLPYSDSWEDPEYIRDVLTKSGFAHEKIEVVQEDTYQRFKDVQEMAAIKTDLFTTLVKGSEGWSSAAAKNEFTDALAGKLLSFDRFYDNGNQGVSAKMIANVAICRK